MDRTHVGSQMVLLHCGTGLSPASQSPITRRSPSHGSLHFSFVLLLHPDGSADLAGVHAIDDVHAWPARDTTSVTRTAHSAPYRPRPTNSICFSRLQRASDVPCCYARSFCRVQAFVSKASRLASTITIIKPHDVLCGLAVIAWHPLLRTLTTAHISRTMDVPEETPTRLTIETAGTSTKHLRLTIVVMAYFIHSTSLWNALIFLNLPLLRKAIRRFVCFCAENSPSGISGY